MDSFITTVTVIVCASHLSFPQHLCIVIYSENIQFSQTISSITNALNGSGVMQNHDREMRRQNKHGVSV